VRNVIRFLVFLVAFVIVGAGPAPAQGALVGTLDCQVTRLQVSRAFLSTLCSFWPFGALAAKTYTGLLTLPIDPLQPSHGATWGVYSSQPLLSVDGTYSKSRPGQFILIGSGADPTELRPLADVPGEEDGPNLASRATELILR
jgi:hypothetical protein